MIAAPFPVAGRRIRSATRRLSTWATVLALVALSNGVIVAQPEVQAAPSEPITLGRVNVIQGSESGIVDVRLPEQATFDLMLRPYRPQGPNRSVVVEGAGRAVAVALVPPAPVYGALVGSERFLISGRFGECEIAGCDPGADVVNFQQPSVYARGATGSRQTLAAGDYRLILIADGAPARIRLVLDGLKGRTRITPTTPAPVDLKTPIVHASHLGGPSYFAAGDTFAGGRRGMALAMLSLRGPKDPLYSAYGMCGFWRGEVNLPEAAAYGPHCQATGMGGAVGTWNEANRFDVVFLQGYGEPDFPPTDLTRGQGVWFTSHNPISRVTSHIFTIVLD